MSLLTVHLTMVSPFGKDDIVNKASGRVEMVPAVHGKYEGSFRAIERITSSIVQGVMDPVELTPGAWEVTVIPTKGSPWPTQTYFLEEGMEEPVNLISLAPDIVINDKGYARGPAGPAGPSGPGITGGVDNGDGTISFTLSNGETVGPIEVPQGPAGHSPEVTWAGTSLSIDGVIGPDLQGPAGTDGENGTDGIDGADGADGVTPLLEWEGTSLAVNGILGPDLKGDPGVGGTDGITPELSWQGTSLAVDGVPGPDLKGEPGENGPPGAPGAGVHQDFWGWVAPPTPYFGQITIENEIIKIHRTSGQNTDWSVVLSALAPGDGLYVQDRYDSSVWARWAITGEPSLIEDLFYIPVVVDEDTPQGLNPSQGRQVVVGMIKAPAQSSSPTPPSIVFSAERPAPSTSPVLWLGGAAESTVDPEPDPDPPVDGVIVFDSFSREDGPLGITEQGSRLWYQTSDDHAIVNQQVMTLAGASNIFSTIDAGTTDVEISATLSSVKADSSPIVGIVLRYTDENNHLVAQVRQGNSLRLWDRVDGITTPVAGYSELVAGDTFGVRAIGSAVEVFHNGVSVGTGSTTRLDGTQVGIFGHGADKESSIDDFTVKEA